ncbi:MAG: diguanylate cyclase [Terracidiphilus sp.]|nr:diguanylate cyclase [Terracidiphilus sp.]
MHDRQQRCHRRAAFSRHRSLLCHCVLLFALVVASIVFVWRFARLESDDNLIWLSNGIILATLLLAPRWKWPIYIAFGFVALVAGTFLVSTSWRMNVLYSVLDIGEALGAASFLRRRSLDLPAFTNHRYLLRFAGIAVFAAPLLTGCTYSATVLFWLGRPFLTSLLHWIAANSLGIAVVTPLLVAIYRDDLRLSFASLWDVAIFSILILLGYFSFSQPYLLLVFLIYPVLTLIVLRFGQGWGAIGLVFVAVEASWFTLHNLGPLAALPKAAPIPVPASIQLQVFLAGGMFIIYAVSSVTDSLREIDRNLNETVYLHELITENLRDVVILADFSGKRSYVSPSATRWGGWQREELEHHHSMDIVHPDDRAEALAVVRSIRNGGEGALLECRVHRKNSDYAWVEANIRPVRDPVTGMPIGVLNMVRDIGERKAAEKQLREAYRTLESLAITDSLTRLANRRHFDRRLQQEWRRCLREEVPLSLLLLDVDYFKSYNDAYGHLRGDSCLQQIAETATNVVTRTGDLVARFGGEEFAVILPGTPNSGALQVARNLRRSICNRRIEHAGNPPGVVTVSIGCATLTPSLGEYAASLVQLADDALYAAKRNGRNRAWNATGCAESSSVSQAS